MANIINPDGIRPYVEDYLSDTSYLNEKPNGRVLSASGVQDSEVERIKAFLEENMEMRAAFLAIQNMYARYFEDLTEATAQSSNEAIKSVSEHAYDSENQIKFSMLNSVLPFMVQNAEEDLRQGHDAATLNTALKKAADDAFSFPMARCPLRQRIEGLFADLYTRDAETGALEFLGKGKPGDLPAFVIGEFKNTAALQLETRHEEPDHVPA